MKKINGLIAITGAMLLTGCASKHIAYQFNDPGFTTKLQRQSVPLWLPRTVVEFRATCEMEMVSPSPLYVEAMKAEKKRRFDNDQLEAAAKLVGAKVGKESSKTIKLKEPVVGVKGERDPEQLFYVYLDNDWMTAVDFSAEYAPDGVIGSVTSTRQDQTLEFTLKTLESTAAIAGALIKSSVFMAVDLTDEPDAIKENVPDALAKKILVIRQHRDDLRFKSSERAGLDGPGLSRLLDDLDKEEAALMAQFEGKSKTVTTPVVITVRPIRGQVTKQIVLTDYDVDGGFAKSEPSPGVVIRSAVPAEFLGKTGTNEAQLVLNLAPRDAKEQAVLESMKKSVAVNGDNGLPYQVPALFSASIGYVDGKQKQTLLFTADLAIGQWGVIARLPVSMGTPGSTIKPVYYNETGALKSLGVSSKPASTDSAKSLSTAATSVTDAVKARDDANSEISQLTKQKTKLELEVAIKKAQDALKPATTGATNP